MSPEQAEAMPLDTRSDIFSFGAVLYEIVTGERAFQGNSKMSVLTSILRDNPQPLGEKVANVPHQLETIVNRCLHKDPRLFRRNRRRNVSCIVKGLANARVQSSGK
jgi:serine/threonine protein kinase